MLETRYAGGREEPTTPAGGRFVIRGLTRRSILFAAHNPATERVVSRYGMRLGAGRFVAGQTLDECVGVLRSLNERGFKVNTTLLGEAVATEDHARGVVASYEAIMARMAAERLDANVALKLSHLGLVLGESVAERNLTRLLEVAQQHRLFIRIDMEESRHVDATLAIYRRLRAKEIDNVGIVLQAYLRRSQADLNSLLPLKANLRLVKGAYLEHSDVAFPKKADVDSNYVALLERSLAGGGYTAVATHDDRVIAHVIDYCRQEAIGPDRFEFQMLYGVRPQLQQDLVREGYRVLVAAPFGSNWYPYLMRRLVERPANVMFLLRNLVRP